MSAKCSAGDCDLNATMAVRTTAPGALRTRVFWDPTDAPSTAEPLCQQHGLALVTDLVKTLARPQ